MFDVAGDDVGLPFLPLLTLLEQVPRRFQREAYRHVVALGAAPREHDRLLRLSVKLRGGRRARSRRRGGLQQSVHRSPRPSDGLPRHRAVRVSRRRIPEVDRQERDHRGEDERMDGGGTVVIQVDATLLGGFFSSSLVLQKEGGKIVLRSDPPAAGREQPGRRRQCRSSLRSASPLLRESIQAVEQVQSRYARGGEGGTRRQGGRDGAHGASSALRQGLREGRERHRRRPLSFRTGDLR
mmetsp:Transcript_47775/g.144470  ORF Transcript_47775/g.144470 Transcript_47775/m.144470 type:complete len:239 (-) Transcript_47775:15-731(-)